MLFHLAIPAGATQFYVAPEGSSRNNGSLSRPWDIITALSHPRTVRPGDTIWLKGGRYPLHATLVSSLRGAAGAPITVRQMPQERATIDCAAAMQGGTGGECLLLRGDHTWYWGFEIMSSNPLRWTFTPGSPADPRGIGIHSQAGVGTKLINLIVHDVGTTLFESRPSGIEITGMIAYNTGWDAPDRSHGPGFYIRNRSAWPTKILRDNILFQHYRQALQGFGSFDNVFSNFLVEGDVLFNNGIGADGFHRNLMFGNVNTGHVNNVFLNNYTYYPPGGKLGSNMFAPADGGCRGLLLRGNVFAHGVDREAIQVNHCRDVVIEDNLFQGGTSFSEPRGKDIFGAAFERRFPANQFFKQEDAPPRGSLVVVRSNPYERNRAHIIIYNWEERCEVGIDLAELGIPAGARYELRSVQDYFGERLVGIYQGRKLTVPMNGWTAAKPIGDYNGELPASLPHFGVFVLTWKVTPWSNRRTRISRFLLGTQPRASLETCALTPSNET